MLAVWCGMQGQRIAKRVQERYYNTEVRKSSWQPQLAASIGIGRKRGTRYNYPNHACSGDCYKHAAGESLACSCLDVAGKHCQ
jgi:hypothetical protein